MEPADDCDGITAGRIHVVCRTPAEGIEPRPVRKTMDWLDYYTHDGDPRGRFHIKVPLISPFGIVLYRGLVTYYVTANTPLADRRKRTAK